MRLFAATLLCTFAILATFEPADARSGRQAGDFCFTDRACAGGRCIPSTTGSRFGECCAVQTCAQQNKQCGFADDGCDRFIFCGQCAAGSECSNFQCVPIPTSTTTSTTLITTTTSGPLETSTTTLP